MTVVDSGIWVSAIRFGGLPKQAVSQIITADQIAVSNLIEAEVVRTLRRKFNFPPKKIDEVLRALWGGARCIVITNEVQGVCGDPNDDQILECARKADASLILAGDKDLLDLGNFAGIPIRSVRTYLSDKGFL